MKIARIRAYALDLPLADGVYAWSGGHSIASFDTTIVRVDTDAGITGWGEVCPLGPFYLPAYANGARSGILELAPHLIGASPLELDRLNRRMDLALKGHLYVKSPIDIACWDILGQVAGLPVCELLGGRFGTDFPVYWSVSQDTPERMVDTMTRIRDDGIRAWQLKVGGPDEGLDIARIRSTVAAFPDDTIVADGNAGWLPRQARKVAKAIEALPVVLEQPCASYGTCREIRRSTPLPFVLDECIDGIEPLIRAISDNALDILNIKIGKVGGLTKARQMRDLCVAAGVSLTIEDMPGGDLTGATILHLAHSTPETHRFSVTSSYLKTDRHFAEGGPKVVDGRTSANTAPGLGVRPVLEMLGAPLFDVTA